MAGGRRYFVTDTSWWLEYGYYSAVDFALREPSVFFVIPAGVMRELDGLKKNPGKRKRAFEATRQIEELMLKRRGTIELDGRRYGVLSSRVDEEVVSVAERYKKDGKKVDILTTDFAQRALALSRGIGIRQEDLENRGARFLIGFENEKGEGINPLSLFIVGGVATSVGFLIEPLLGGFLAFLTVLILLKKR